MIMKKMTRNKKTPIHKMVLDEVVEELLTFCEDHPLSIANIAKQVGVSRQTVQRLFDRKPVHIRSLHMIKKWLDSFDSSQE